MSASPQLGEPTAAAGWYRSLRGPAKPAFFSSAAGWGLDSFTYMIFPLVLGAVSASFGLSKAEAGWISTGTLVASALGGAVAGMIADRIGRVRTLMFVIGIYSVFTVLCAIAPNYESLLVLRILLGFGMGGEWAAGALLIAELCEPRYRGRIMGAVAGAWNVGWGLAVLLYSLLFSLLDPDIAWRLMFAFGVLPAVLILYIRRRVPEPMRTRPEPGGARPRTFRAIFRGGLGRRTVLACLLATGVQGGNYAVVTWLPSYLRQARHLTAVGTGTYLVVLIIAGVIGSLVAGACNDRFGRRPTFVIFAIGCVAVLVVFALLSGGGDAVLILLAITLGFFSSGIFAGFGSYLAELYPESCRGTGQGFCYNLGRGLGAFFPALVGYLTLTVGFAGAIGFAAVGYLLALVSLVFLPETRAVALH